jgi:hypothetical protein
MLLEAILKHSLRAGLEQEAKSVEMAFHVMTVVPNQANDMMDIGRLQGFEVNCLLFGFILYFMYDECKPCDNFKASEVCHVL